ncbi:basic phospholipase A2 PA-12A [Diachasma alloeum]|uniref:basic phospholipase A2 PA-12A n=1 Tax=Diachasma alloeum TaxID=454923 RepID=UPI00073850C8|nr:basic phospholipase A2 PA-12A [Diachasma alloeum]
MDGSVTKLLAHEELHNLTMHGFGESEEDIHSMRPSSKISVTYNSSTNSLRLSERFGASSRRTRRKRSVVHLYNMVVCATGCNPLAYKGYGCYCGFLGSGYPVDGIDRCCWMHDRCYDATGCPTFSEYFIPYYWKCYRGHLPICAILHGSWGGSGSCAQRLCECDRALAKCLRRFPCPSSKAVCTSSPFRLVQNIFMIL